MQDSFGFWILRREYRIPSTRSRIFGSETWIPNIAIVRDSGFLEMYLGFQILEFRIPQGQISRILLSLTQATSRILSQSRYGNENYPILRLTLVLFLACLVTMCPHLSHHYKFLDYKQWISDACQRKLDCRFQSLAGLQIARAKICWMLYSTQAKIC